MNRMATRQSVIVELATEARLAAGTSRAQRVAELRRAAEDAKRLFLQEVERLRAVDPDMEILSQETLFPLLVVTTTEAVVEALPALPGVLRVSPAPEHTLTPRPS